jgi:hypothetical protein
MKPQRQKRTASSNSLRSSNEAVRTAGPVHWMKYKDVGPELCTR